MKGTVKWFNRKKGYGFIIGEDGNEYFVHYSKIVGDGYKVLDDDQDVTFEVAEENGRKQAVNVVAA